MNADCLRTRLFKPVKRCVKVFIPTSKIKPIRIRPAQADSVDRYQQVLTTPLCLHTNLAQLPAQAMTL